MCATRRRRLGVQLRAVAACALAVVLAACSGAQSAGVPPQSAFEVYRIGGDEAFPPFEYVAESGAYKGFNVDLMNAIGIELGIQIELIPLPWSYIRQALENGDICAIQGMKRTPARESQFLFSDEYLESSMAIFVRTTEFGIAGLDDLVGRTVSVQRADAAHERLAALAGVELRTMPSQEAALVSVVAGGADAYVGNRLAGIHIAQKRGTAEYIKITGDAIDPMPYAMAFRKADRELAAMFNEGIAKVKASGTYDKIHAKWFGRPIEGFLGLDRARIRWLLSTSALILAAAVLIAAWNLSLRRLVAAKTTEIAQVNALNQQILESSCDGIAAIDSGLNFIWANGTAMRLMGWKYGPVAGVNLSETLLAPLAYRTPLRRIASEEAAATRCDVELNIGGEPRIFNVSLMPLMPQASSACCGVLLLFSDATMLRRSEQIESTDLVMSALARSISGVAAAIRNPLLSIREYLEQLPDRHDQREFIDEICGFVPSEIDRVNAAIGDLALLTRPEPPEPKSFDLAACVKEALSRIRAEADSRGIIIRSQLADTEAFADEAQIADAVYRVVANIVESSRYRSEVEVDLQIANEASAEIEVRNRVSDAGARYARIERAEQKAAELFFRAAPGDSALGMAVAYRILQSNGGLITASATPDGVCVKMTIPRGRRG
ncbi:MAG: transporter substrate-binding domain-containing protein [Bacillota bacterium]|jgi:ABC-type amino acid transport substrate-binding protein/signal transduction histidine kinase